MSRFLAPFILLAAFAPAALHAQTNCGARVSVVEKLATGYGETFAGGGVQNSNRIFEVWFSEDKGTWTILMTRADGTSCIMASGTHWLDGPLIKREPEGTPS